MKNNIFTNNFIQVKFEVDFDKLHLIYKKWDIFIKTKILKKILLIYNMEMKQGLMLMIIHPKCEIK